MDWATMTQDERDTAARAHIDEQLAARGLVRAAANPWHTTCTKQGSKP